MSLVDFYPVEDDLEFQIPKGIIPTENSSISFDVGSEGGPTYHLSFNLPEVLSEHSGLFTQEELIILLSGGEDPIYPS